MKTQLFIGDDTLTEATYTNSYKNREGLEWTVTAYLPCEGEETMVINNVASTKRKVYVEYPECYVEIQSPGGGINAHHLTDEKELKKFLHHWSGIWGVNFWKELEDRYFI